MAGPQDKSAEEKDVDIRIDSLTYELRQLALRDPLTGLLNRRGFDEELRRIWTQSQNNPFPIGLLVMDIDHFKAINDSYGHAVGDQVLKESAQIIRMSVRETDIVCRYYGGDEMVVILPNSPAEHTRKVAERMVSCFQTQVLCQDTYDLKMTISVGVCNMQADPGQSSDRFLMQADRALYRAKQTGRNRVCFADEMTTPFEPQEEPPEVTAAPAGMAESRRVALVVDDDPAVCTLFQRMLTRENYGAFTAGTGAAALEILKRERGMVDVALVDLLLLDENGLDVLKKLREIDDTLIGVVITGQATLESAISSLRTGAFDFVPKPVSPGQLAAVLDRAIKYRRLLLENRRYQHHLEEMVREKNSTLERALEHVNDSYQFTLEAMAEMLDMREHKTGEHSKRVARMSYVLAREMGVSQEEMDTIQTGALLHDIGKIGIPDAILLKKGPLTPEEREVMRHHSHIGYNFIKAGPGLEEASEIVLSHQERYDGTGYPRGLKGEAICLGARIFAVVDSYDAIRSDRPYSNGRSAQEALAEIQRHKGTQFDPVVVAALQRCWAEIENVGRWPLQEGETPPPPPPLPPR